MKWRRLRAVTTPASVIAERSSRGEGAWSRMSGAERLPDVPCSTPSVAGSAATEPRTGTVFARRRARELEEHVIESRAAQPEVADLDPGAAQLRGRLLDQLETIAGSWKRQPVGALARLGIAAADAGEHRLGAVALGGAGELDLENLPANLVL